MKSLLHTHFEKKKKEKENVSDDRYRFLLTFKAHAILRIKQWQQWMAKFDRFHEFHRYFRWTFWPIKKKKEVVEQTVPLVLSHVNLLFFFIILSHKKICLNEKGWMLSVANAYWSRRRWLIRLFLSSRGPFRDLWNQHQLDTVAILEKFRGYHWSTKDNLGMYAALFIYR